MALDELARQSAIRPGGSSARSIFQNRFSKARGLAQSHAARNYSFINAFAKMLTHVLNYLLAKIGPSIEHCHHDPAQL